MVESYRIIPDDRRMEAEADINAVSAAVLVHLFYEEQVEYCRKYMDRLPTCIDIVILSPKDDILRRFPDERYVKIKKENRGRDISALLVAARAVIFRYQYICFVHDKKEKREEDREYVDLWRKNMWDNTLGSSEYVYNVLATLESESRLGLLVPPPPHQEDKGVWLKGDWGGTFDLVRNLADEINLSADIHYDVPPITYSTVFWARTRALKKLYSKKWAYGDFPDEPMKNNGEINHAVERILQYVADDAGYGTEIILSSTFAAGFVLQLKGELNRIRDGVRNVFGAKDYRDICGYGRRVERIKEFAKSHSDLYLYGAGSAGKDCIRMCTLLGIALRGVLVTDTGDYTVEIDGVQILPISALSISEETGIIITVYETAYQNEIRETLNRKGFYRYMVF